MPKYHNRFIKLAKHLGYSLNTFAKKGLGYSSYEKLRRLGDSVDNKPSIDILEDVNSKFPNVNLDWLITGTGTMMKDGGQAEIDLDSIKEDEVQLAILVGYLSRNQDELLENSLYKNFIDKSYKHSENKQKRDELKGKVLDKDNK